MRLFAIDPGPEVSALVTYDAASARPTFWTLAENEDLIKRLDQWEDHRLVIEKVESFGMAVGESTFETVFWSGRFAERWTAATGLEAERIGRKAVKLHLCGTARAKDANVRQAIIDRFGPGKSKAVGLKASPGPLYGIKSHLWAALALAITAADVLPEGLPAAPSGVIGTIQGAVPIDHRGIRRPARKRI